MNGQLLPTWEQLAEPAPVLTATMRRYLDQIDCVLRPSSVHAADVGLRMFATFIVEAHPDVTAVARLQRTHLEDYKRWLLDRRSGRGQTRLRCTGLTLPSLRLADARPGTANLPGWPKTPPMASRL